MVSVAVTADAAADELQVTSATAQVRSNNRWTWEVSGTTSQATGNSIRVTVATTNGTLDLGLATLTATTTGARWRLSVTTVGAGPASPPTVTVRSALGQSITAPLTIR